MDETAIVGIGTRTDTVKIPVIDADPVCAWCRVRLAAIPDRPVDYLEALYHPTCAVAARALATGLLRR